MATSSQNPPTTRQSAPSAAGESPEHDLLSRLRRAAGRDLLRLVDEHGRQLTLREVRQVLLNPFVDGEVIRALAANRKLVTVYEVRVALARHRRTPESVSMRWLSGLFWRDLSEITLDAQLRIAVRRVAERYLLQRLSRLSTGERIALARRSVATVAARLIREAHPRVVAAGLDNPRLDEKALLTVVGDQASSAHLLDTIASHPRWQYRYEVRAALCRNPLTPFRIILRHLETLQPEELSAVAANRDHAGFVCALARELLDSHAAAWTIGLESATDTAQASKLHTSRLARRFDLASPERGGEPISGQPIPSSVHEKEEKDKL